MRSALNKNINIIISTAAATASSSCLLQRRNFESYHPFMTGRMRDSALTQQFKGVNKAQTSAAGVMVDPSVDAATRNKAAISAASHTGSFLNNSFDSVEEMFNPSSYLKVEAKSLRYSKSGHTAYYVVPSIDVDIVPAAVELFSRFSKDVAQVELFYRKFIRSFPATVHIVGTAAEIAAFEAAEEAKIPNNKLIVGRSNAKVHHVNIREEIFDFYSNLINLGAASEAEIKAYATPILERWISESYVSRHYLWDLEEELVRSMATLPTPASTYELRCFSAVLERSVKCALNAVADLPWASEDYSCPTRGINYSGYRGCAEAGMW